jgi:hypothetical protein
MSDNNDEETDEPLTFGKGLRVRITEDDTLGEIVWWGKSKYGPEMRAGVQPEDDEADTIWVDATQLRAVDEEGNDLEPQPMVDRPTLAPTGTVTRPIEIPDDLGRAFTAVRLQRGYPESKAPSATIRLDRLQQAEEAIGCTIPDPVIAYVASALGSLREVGGIVELTLELHSRREEELPIERAPVLAFDYDNGDFLTFRRGAERATESVALFLHEGGYEDSAEMSLTEWLTDQLDGKVPARTTPLQVGVDYVTRDEPEPEPDEQWVSHAKFGRGVVLSSEETSKGDKLAIRFEDGEIRKLLDRFVEYQ